MLDRGGRVVELFRRVAILLLRLGTGSFPWGCDS